MKNRLHAQDVKCMQLGCVNFMSFEETSSDKMVGLWTSCTWILLKPFGDTYTTETWGDRPCYAGCLATV